MIHLSLITKIISLSFENGCFPDDLELAKVNPIFKKNNDLDKENYRLVSVLFNVSKAFERTIYSQIDAFMQDKLSKLLIDFRKNHSTPHCLMYMLLFRKMCWIEENMCYYVHGLIKGF